MFQVIFDIQFEQNTFAFNPVQFLSVAKKKPTSTNRDLQQNQNRYGKKITLITFDQMANGNLN